MNSSAVRPVPIDLGDGKDRALLFTGSAIEKIERAEDNASIYSVIIRESGLSYLTTMIWGGLLWQVELPPLTRDQVSDIVFAQLFRSNVGHPALFNPVYEALMECGVLRRRTTNGDGTATEEAPEGDPTKRAPNPPASANTTS